MLPLNWLKYIICAQSFLVAHINNLLEKYFSKLYHIHYSLEDFNKKEHHLEMYFGLR